jgi:hypothetical protein
MPVYLVFLQVAKNNLQLALRGPNLPVSLEAGKLQQGPGTKDIFLSYVSYCQNSVSANLLKPNCSKIFHI